MTAKERAAIRAYERVARQHRATLDRILDRRGVAGLRALYDQLQGELQRKIARGMRAGMGDSMTVLQMRQLLAQVREGQQVITERLAKGMEPALREAQAEGIRQTSRSIIQLEMTYTGAAISLPIEEAATFAGLLDKRTPSLIRANATSFRRYGARLTERIERELALSLATGETPIKAIDRVQAVADNEWWQAERIVRTESAYAYNAGHADAGAACAEELPDLHNRWTELVDDVTGRALDGRVAEDSLVLHGQIARPGTPFRMPSDERVSAKLWGKAFMFGPNRPNDRSVTLHWRPHWGIPAYRMEGTTRVPVKAEPATD